MKTYQVLVVEKNIGVTLVAQAGTSGRSYVIICEHDSLYEKLAREIFETLETTAKVFFFECSTVDKDTWRLLSEQFISSLGEQKIRQASFIAFGSASTLSQYGYLRVPKIVRSMFLVDSAVRPHPTKWDLFVDWLEVRFPLGLPLRGESKNFNARSHLQRIRCPVLWVTTQHADEFLKNQAKEGTAIFPTAWWCDLPTEYPDQNQAEVLVKLLDGFQEIPAKCPQ